MSLRKKNKTCLESFGSGEPELFFVLQTRKFPCSKQTHSL